MHFGKANQDLVPNSSGREHSIRTFPPGLQLFQSRMLVSITNSDTSVSEVSGFPS